MSAKQTTRRIKLSSARAGHVLDDEGNCVGAFSNAAGDVIEVPAAEAERMITRGLATPVND